VSSFIAIFPQYSSFMLSNSHEISEARTSKWMLRPGGCNETPHFPCSFLCLHTRSSFIYKHGPASRVLLETRLETSEFEMRLLLTSLELSLRWTPLMTSSRIRPRVLETESRRVEPRPMPTSSQTAPHIHSDPKRQSKLCSLWERIIRCRIPIVESQETKIKASTRKSQREVAREDVYTK